MCGPPVCGNHARAGKTADGQPKTAARATTVAIGIAAQAIGGDSSVHHQHSGHGQAQGTAAVSRRKCIIATATAPLNRSRKVVDCQPSGGILTAPARPSVAAASGPARITTSLPGRAYAGAI